MPAAPPVGVSVERRRFERFVLLYTPGWTLAVAVVMLGGLIPRLGETGLLLFGLALALPPWLTVPWRDGLRRALASRALHLNLWIAGVVFLGSYLWSHYFFDLMGMRYAFGTRLHLEAWGLGHPGGQVPLFLYPLTHAYFVTYYVGMAWALRRLRAGPGAPLARRLPALALISYAVAFAETFTMNVPALAPYFGYGDRGTMLLLGSVPYGLVFFVTLPLFEGLEAGRTPAPPDGPAARPLAHTFTCALAAGMAGLLVLDAWGWLFGPLPGGPR